MKKRSKDHKPGRLIALLLAAALVFGTFTTLPDKAYAAGASDIQVGDHIDIGRTDAQGYTGIPHWRVLDKKEDGSMLLMSEYLWTGNGTDPAAKVRFLTSGPEKIVNGQTLYWRGTLAEAWCDDFCVAVLSGVEGLNIVKTTGSDGEFVYEQSLYAEGNNKKLFFSAADVILYQHDVFFLSAEEVASYIPDPRDRKAHMPDSNTTEQWLLRSSQRDTEWASEVKPDGELAAVSANTYRAVRPAFQAKLSDSSSFTLTVDETGARTWTVSEEQGETPGEDQGDDAQKPVAPASVKNIKTVTVNSATVSAKTIDKAVKRGGGSAKYVTKVILGSKVKKISPKAFAKYKKVTALEVRTKKLKKKSVKNSLKGSKVKTIKVKVAKKAKTNKAYVKKYKKIFIKKNSGRKVSVKR